MKKICLFAFFVAATIAELAAKVPVYIVAGQSNTDGRALLAEMPAAIRAYAENGGSEKVMMSYCNGMTRNETGRFERYVPKYEADNSKMCGFDAFVYHAMDSLSDGPVYIIKESKGGTAIDTLCSSSGSLYWNADPAWLERAGTAHYDRDTKESTGKSLLLQLEANIAACVDNELSRLPEGYEFKCIIWHQGESDRKMAANYHDNLKKVVAHIRGFLAEKTGDEKYARLPFIAGSVSTESRQWSAGVEDAKRRLAAEDENFHVVDLEGCRLRDDDRLHFDATGCAEAGKRVVGKLTELGLMPVSE